MDSVTVIVTALAAGAAEALKDGAKDTVLKAYHGLRDKVKALFAGNDAAEIALSEHEKAPEDWERPLAAKLAEFGADRDPELRSAAESLLALLDVAPASGSKYNLSIRDSQVFSVGDHNHQVINMGDGTARLCRWRLFTAPSPARPGPDARAFGTMTEPLEFLPGTRVLDWAFSGRYASLNLCPEKAQLRARWSSQSDGCCGAGCRSPQPLRTRSCSTCAESSPGR